MIKFNDFFIFAINSNFNVGYLQLVLLLVINIIIIMFITVL